MGIVDTLPVKRVRPVLCLPLWLGTLRDGSDYGNHATNVGCHWSDRNGKSKVAFESTDRLIVSDSASLQLTKGTLCFFGNVDGYSSTDRFISKRDGGGTNYDLRMETFGSISLWDGVGTKTLVTKLSGARSIIVTIESGQISRGYVDGSDRGNFSGVSTITVNDADLIIGNLYNGANPSSNPCDCVIIYNDTLTAPEIASLHEWSQARITPSKQWPGSGLRYPDRPTYLLEDWQMEESGTSAWTPVINAILTKEAGSPSGKGNQVLRVQWGGTNYPIAAQLSVCPIGRPFKASGWIRGDGTGTKPQILVGNGNIAFDGDTSTTWQYFEVITISSGSSGHFYCRAQSGTGWAEFDDLRLEALPLVYTPLAGDPLYRDNIQSARVSLANETAGQLSNTGYTIQSGTWKVKEDSAGRYIECIGAGTIHRKNTEVVTTWEFEFQRPGIGDLYFVLMGTHPVWNNAANNGYTIRHRASQEIAISRITNGAGVAFVGSAVTGIPLGRYSFRVTRANGGLFKAYIKGESYEQWTEIISGTDNTYTATKYVSINAQIADRLYLDRQCFGVIAP